MNRGEQGLRDYWMAVSRRRWSALTVFLAIVAASAVLTALQTPIYKATAQLYIEAGANQFNLQQGSDRPIDENLYLQTQVSILKSETIGRRVVSKLGLDQMAASGAENKGRFSLAGLLGFGKKGDPGENAAEKALKKYMKRLDVEAVKNSSLVKVSYEDENPQTAAQVANATVQAYIDQGLEMKVAPAKEYMGWLSGELGKIKGKMDETSNQLESFKRQKNLIVTGEGQSNISLSALSDLNAKVLAAEAKRYEAEIKYQQVQKLSKEPDGLMSLPEVINNKLIQDLKTQEGALAKQIAEQSKKYGEKHPQMVRLLNEKETLRRQLKSEVDLIVSSIKNDYDDSVKAENSLRRALERQKAEAMSYARRSSEYELKKQDVEGAKGIYDQVLKKVQETNIMGSINVSSVQVLDSAVPPGKPDKPRKGLNIFLGLVFGMFTAVGFALVSEHLDQTYRVPEHLEEDLGVPFLGIVPKNIDQEGKDRDTVTAITDPMSPVSESFRTIRTNLLLSRKDTNPRVVQVVSALRGEGKSTVSVNLACIMAAAGDKVVLIDGDMRRPRVHKFFNISNDKGLSSVLTLKTPLSEVITRTSVQKLNFIPSGPLYKTPGELLGGEVMRETVALLREKYDRVIIDCPPYLGIADASILTPLSDGVVLVVRSGRTIKDAVLKIKRGMEGIRAEILGFVLNDMERRSIDYYYHYDYNSYIRNEDKDLDEESRAAGGRVKTALQPPGQA